MNSPPQYWVAYFAGSAKLALMIATAGVMTKITIMATIGALSFLVVVEEARAQRTTTPSQSQTTSGVCPIGTCAPNGGQNARDVKNCKAANCKKK